ncbi:MAG: hypothetical protein L6R19_04860 [Alphaproteobacteria bacterium]|nr:hypothetical protein [Alphaproteobacteria bacterium]
MAQVVIRNIDDDVIERLKAKARANKKSLEQTLRETLIEAARPSRRSLLAKLERIRALTPKRPKAAPLAEEIIREDRDKR